MFFTFFLECPRLASSDVLDSPTISLKDFFGKKEPNAFEHLRTCFHINTFALPRDMSSPVYFAHLVAFSLGMSPRTAFETCKII